jgi:hypothetical protein
MADYEKIKQDNEREVQDEIKKMSLNKELGGRDKELLDPKANEKKLQENKCAIILDNIALKLGVKDKGDIVNVLKNKLDYLKTHNMPKYLELMGQQQEQPLHAWKIQKPKLRINDYSMCYFLY